jgi:nitrogen regulatory protein P-II 1
LRRRPGSDRIFSEEVAMKKITAIVRTSALERIIRSLQEGGIRSLTISEVKGIGDQVHLFSPYEIHSRLEIIVSEDRAQEVADAILEEAHTGFAGDGIIAVSPMDYMIKIRSRKKMPE